MKSCEERKRFDQEWEAYAFIRDHPPEEPAPPQYIYHCQHCAGFHISEYPEGKNNGKARRRRKGHSRLRPYL